MTSSAKDSLANWIDCMDPVKIAITDKRAGL